MPIPTKTETPFTEALEKLKREFADRWRGLGTDEPEEVGVISQHDFDSFLSRAAQLGAEHVYLAVEKSQEDDEQTYASMLEAARQGYAEVKGE